MRVYRVLPSQVVGVWPQISAFILAALARQSIELWSEWDLKRALMGGGPWLLWVAEENETPTAAIITRIDDHPRARGCTVFLAGGHDRSTWYDVAEAEIRDYARSLGCSFLEARGRQGWEKITRAAHVERVYQERL